VRDVAASGDKLVVLGEVACALLVEVGERRTLPVEHGLALLLLDGALRSSLAQPVLHAPDERAQVSKDVRLDHRGGDRRGGAEAGVPAGVAALVAASVVAAGPHRRSADGAEQDAVQGEGVG
jgi:hypothetical protein